MESRNETTREEHDTALRTHGQRLLVALVLLLLTVGASFAARQGGEKAAGGAGGLHQKAAAAGALHFSPEPDGPLVPGIIEFGAIEDDTILTVAGVVRTGGALGEVSVDYVTEPGSAEPGSDYLPAAGSFVFGEDDLQIKAFDVEILEDEEIEADEAFTVRLANPQGGAQLIGASTARVGIFSDEFSAPEDGPVPLGPERVVHSQRQGRQANESIRIFVYGFIKLFISLPG